MNVTRERIRQIEAKALRRLRNPDLSKEFTRLFCKVKLNVGKSNRLG